MARKVAPSKAAKSASDTEREFLERYDVRAFERPSVTVDVVITPPAPTVR